MSVSPMLVKELREKTSAGMLDCKKALEESSGNMEKAVEWLRKNGLSKAMKKSSRLAAEGVVSAYIHGDGKIGVLLEAEPQKRTLWLENKEFQHFTKDIAMHIAALAPQYISQEEISLEEREKEKSILSEKALKEKERKKSS